MKLDKDGRHVQDRCTWENGLKFCCPIRSRENQMAMLVMLVTSIDFVRRRLIKELARFMKSVKTIKTHDVGACMLFPEGEILNKR